MTDERTLSSLRTISPRLQDARRPPWTIALVFALGCNSAQAGGTREPIEQTTSPAGARPFRGARLKAPSTGGMAGAPGRPTTALGVAAGVPGGTDGAPSRATGSPAGATSSLAGAPQTLGSTGCVHNVQRRNASGFINTAPQVWNIYWGNYWNQTSGSPSGASQAAALDSAGNWVANSAAFWNRLVEYGIDPNHSTWKGSFVREPNLDATATSSMPKKLDEHTIQTMLGAEFDALGTSSPYVPSATLNPPQICVIFLPPNVQSQVDIDNSFSGHHLVFQWHGRNVWYAVVEHYITTDLINGTATHEIAETATDPDTTTGYQDPTITQENEIADLCESSSSIAGFNVDQVWSQQACRCVTHRDPYTSDFGGNGKSSYTIFRPSTGTWWVNSGVQSIETLGWGVSTDIPVPGDYNGDGWIDIAIFRPSTGQWIGTYNTPLGLNDYSQWQAGPNGFTTNWGANGDIALPADWDADNKIDLTVFRPSNNTWYALLSSNGAGVSAAWGFFGDVPVPADFDGDGKADIAVYRPSNSTYYIAASTQGAYAVAWGTSGDVPIPADFDGDGTADIAIWRPSNGTWYVRPSSNTGTMWTRQWGVNGDIPVPMDFDGDWRADYAVWRPSNGTWYVIPTTTGNGYSVQWGVSGDIPMPPDR